MTQTATDHQPPVTLLMIEQAREKSEQAAEAYRQAQRRMTGVLSDKQALTLGEARARAEGTAEALERLLETRQAQESVVIARQQREDDAQPDIDRLERELTASGDRLNALTADAEKALVEAIRCAGEHDALVARAREVLLGHDLMDLRGHDFASVVGNRSVRVAGRWWQRLDVGAVLARSMRRVSRAVLPGVHHVTLHAQGIARGLESRLDQQLFEDALDLGVAEQPKIVRPERAEVRPTVVRV